MFGRKSWGAKFEERKSSFAALSYLLACFLAKINQHFDTYLDESSNLRNFSEKNQKFWTLKFLDHVDVCAHALSPTALRRGKSRWSGLVIFLYGSIAYGWHGSIAYKNILDFDYFLHSMAVSLLRTALFLDVSGNLRYFWQKLLPRQLLSRALWLSNGPPASETPSAGTCYY